jgi:hypothetical protein
MRVPLRVRRVPEERVIDALSYLRSVYNDPLQPTNTRLKAAAIAIEYERPRLAVTALVQGEDFAARLNKAIARSREGLRLIEQSPAPKHPSQIIIKRKCE